MIYRMSFLSRATDGVLKRKKLMHIQKTFPPGGRPYVVYRILGVLFFFPASTNKIYSTLLTKSRFIRERERERVIDITFVQF